MQPNSPREKLAADLLLLEHVAPHIPLWSCGLIKGQSLTIGDLRAIHSELTARALRDEPALRDLLEVAVDKLGTAQQFSGLNFADFIARCRMALDTPNGATPPVPAARVAPSDALRQVEALLDAMETCHICRATLLVDDGPTYCAEGGCSYDCECHKGPECTPISTLHQQARRALSALAQQLQEAERLRASLEWARAEKHSAQTAEEQVRNANYALQSELTQMRRILAATEGEVAELRHTREALAVAEGALRQVDELIVCADVRMDAGPLYRFRQQGQHDAAITVRAALKGAPTGTPKGEAE